MSDETQSREIPEAERDALVTIAHGAVVTSGGISIQRAVVTTTEVMLTRGLGPVRYGVYALAWRIAQLLLRFVDFGTVSTLQRYVPATGPTSIRRGTVAGLAYGTTVVVGIAIGLSLFLGASWIDEVTLRHPMFPPTLGLFGLLVGLAGLVRIHGSLLRAVGSARGEVAFNRILHPVGRFVGAAGALVLGGSVVAVAGGMVASVGVIAVVGFPLVIHASGIRPSLRGSRAVLIRFYNHAAPVAFSSIGKVFQSRIDVLLVGALLSATAAGTYNVVLVLVSITWIPLLAFNQLLPPIASDLHAADRTRTLNAVYTAVTRLIVTAVVPLIAVLFVFGPALLSVFGPTYAAGYEPLIVYLAGVLVGSAVGATGWLLMMTDHQYARLALDWLLAGLNVVLTTLFVLEFGLTGAALGTAIAISVQNALQVLLLRRFEGLWPFDTTFIKPLVAGLTMTAAMWLIRSAVDGPMTLGIGLPVGFAVYFATLSIVGINPRDRLVVGELARQYRQDLRGIVGWS